MPSATRPTHVALLRGINLGPRNRVPMKDLAEMFLAAGCTCASTYIASGNVLFAAPARVLRNIPETIAASIAERFQFRVPVITRSADELTHAIRQNPLPEDAPHLHVYFLADAPNAEAIARLDPARVAPDTFEVRGREVYASYASGMARTKLTNAWLDSKLSTISTARNWATVRKLAELLA